MPPAPRGSAVLLAAVAVGITSPLAVAAPTWLTPATLSPATGDAVLPVGGLDGSGGAVSVWQQSTGGGQTAILAATHAPGGAWSVAQPISAPGDGEAEQPAPAALTPDLAVAGNGTAVAVWRYRDGGGSVVEANVRSGGAWRGPQVISRAARRQDSPVVAVNATGDAVAVWVRQGQESASVQASTRPADGQWSPPVTISAPGATEAAAPAVVRGAGGVVAVWAWRGGPGDLWRVQSAALPDGGTWHEPQDISAVTQTPPTPAVVMDAAGVASAVWDQAEDGTSAVHLATRGVDGAWTAPVGLTDSEGSVGAPGVAVLSDGAIVMATAVPMDVLRARILVRTRDAAGMWADPVLLGAENELAGHPVPVALPGGGAAVAWDGCPSLAPCGVRAAERRSGVWTPELLPDNTVAVGTVSADPAGDILLVGTAFRDDTPSAVVQAITRDAAGPNLDAAAVPAEATVGTPANMSLVGTDTWSALLDAPHWTFTDGGEADGAQVTHTFTTPGDHTVTVTQADILGNRTTVRRTVRVATPPLAFSAPLGGDVPQPSVRPATELSVRAVRAACLPSGAVACRVRVSFTLNASGRVRVRVALRGRRGAYAVTMSGRRGLNALRLPARIAGVRVGPGTDLAVTVRPTGA